MDVDELPSAEDRCKVKDHVMSRSEKLEAIALSREVHALQLDVFNSMLRIDLG